MNISVKTLLLAAFLLSVPSQQAYAVDSETIKVGSALVVGALGGWGGYAIAQGMMQSETIQESDEPTAEKILKTADDKTKKLILTLSATGLGFVVSALLVYALLSMDVPAVGADDAPRLVRRNAFRINREDNVDFQARELVNRLAEQRGHDAARLGIAVGRTLERRNR